MEERMKGPVLFQRPWSVPLVFMVAVLVAAVLGFVFASLLPPGSLPPIIGDVFQGGD